MTVWSICVRKDAKEKWAFTPKHPKTVKEAELAMLSALGTSPFARAIRYDDDGTVHIGPSIFWKQGYSALTEARLLPAGDTSRPNWLKREGERIIDTVRRIGGPPVYGEEAEAKGRNDDEA